MRYNKWQLTDSLPDLPVQEHRPPDLQAADQHLPDHPAVPIVQAQDHQTIEGQAAEEHLLQHAEIRAIIHKAQA